MKSYFADNIPLHFEIEKSNQLKEMLVVPSRIVITTHHRPDGDAMGSSLALYNFLIQKGHTVHVIIPNECPDFLTWLPGNDKVINYEKNISEGDQLISKASIIFCLDYNNLSRIDKMETPLRKCQAKKILLDHHLDPEDVFHLSFSYSDVSSTSELVFDLIHSTGDLELVNKNVAECIYCGIMTDTNSFRFSSMKSRTHRIISFLMDTGIENSKIHELVYDTNSESRMRLMGYSLFEKMVVLREYNTAYIALSEKELNRFNFKSGDTEGFVNLGLGIGGIKLAVLFTEREGLVRISFRSKGDFSVKELSAAHFNGGGHKNASGGNSVDSLDNTIKKFISLLPFYKTKLNEKD